VVAQEGIGVADLLAVIQHVYEARRGVSRDVAVWSQRLGEWVREQLLESLPVQAIQEHAMRVAAKIEDPYSALSALISLIKENHAD
jgi:Lon protease-like protein